MNNNKTYSYNCQNIPTDYELLDSGNLKKLERYGDKLIIRPSTLAIWQPQLAANAWAQADAEYHGQAGWQFTKKPFESWMLNLDENTKMKLRPQKNGQIGIFPEHYAYLEMAKDFIGDQKIKCLNLFAYTGMASLSLSQYAEVTHVEIAKACLDWTSENIELNQAENIRIIKDDAFSFLQRAVKKNQHYNLIIADPPSFSRVSKNKNWSLEEVLPKLINLLAQVIDPNKFMIIFTSHLQQHTPETIANLFYDTIKTDLAVETATLNLSEANSKRKLPLGNLTIATH